MTLIISFILFGLNLAWLLLLLLARFTAGGRPWPIEMLDTFALYAFAPFVPLIVLAVLRRGRRALLLSLAVLVLFFQQFGAELVPHPRSVDASGPRLLVLTYNVSSYNPGPTELVGLIAQTGPDVILLQELTTAYASGLGAQLGDDYPYRVLVDTGSAHFGSGTFSRLPLSDPEAFSLRPRSNAWQRINLTVAGRSVRLYNLHFSSPHFSYSPSGSRRLPAEFGSPAREAELAWIAAETAQLDTPFILAGDFNIAAGTQAYRSFPLTWRDAFAERGALFGHTFPTSRHQPGDWLTLRWPLVRIDYVLSSRDLAPRSAEVRWLDGSDHLPVLAELELGSSS